MTRALLEKGYTAEQINKIYGGNTLRVMREVEKTAKAIQAQAPPANGDVKQRTDQPKNR